MAATRPAWKFVAADDTLIFDAGTGIRPLGNALAKAAQHHRFRYLPEPRPHRSRDRPAVLRAAVREAISVVRVWAGILQPAGGVEEAVRKLMSFPFFPLRSSDLHAKLEFHDFRAGDVINPRPGITLAHRAAQSSGRRDRLSDRVRRPIGRLCDRYRNGRRRRSIRRCWR